MNNYLKFMGGNKATIRTIVEKYQNTDEGLAYFKVSLEEYDEIIKLSVPIEKVNEICAGTIIKYDYYSIGYCRWKNGIGPYGIVTKIGA